MNIQLKNCPTCGSENIEFYGKPNNDWVQCKDCETEAPLKTWQGKRNCEKTTQSEIIRRLCAAAKHYRELNPEFANGLFHAIEIAEADGDKYIAPAWYDMLVVKSPPD